MTDTLRDRANMEILDVFKNVNRQVFNREKQQIAVFPETILPNTQRDTGTEVNVDKSIEQINKIIETKVIDNKIKDKVASHNKVLMEFYTKEILTNFYLIWTESKIKIVIDMTKYLLGESQAAQYARSIEIFMIPVDNRVCSYILEI
jgi:hypothetical protein